MTRPSVNLIAKLAAEGEAAYRTKDANAFAAWLIPNVLLVLGALKTLAEINEREHAALQHPPSQFHAYEALKAIRNVVDSQRPPKTLEEALSDLRATYGLADAALCQKCGASPGERHDRLAHTRPVQGEGS